MAGRRQKSHRARSRRARSQQSHQVHETPEEMRSRVLGAFERWLDARLPAGPARGDVLRTVQTACEFKDTSLDSPNPADWSPDLVDEIIGHPVADPLGAVEAVVVVLKRAEERREENEGLHAANTVRAIFGG